VRNIEDDDGVGRVVDPVADAPVTSSAGRALTYVLIPQGVPNAVGVVQQRPGDELGHGDSDLSGS